MAWLRKTIVVIGLNRPNIVVKIVRIIFARACAICSITTLVTPCQMLLLVVSLGKSNIEL